MVYGSALSEEIDRSSDARFNCKARPQRLSESCLRSFSFQLANWFRRKCGGLFSWAHPIQTGGATTFFTWLGDCETEPRWRARDRNCNSLSWLRRSELFQGSTRL